MVALVASGDSKIDKEIKILENEKYLLLLKSKFLNFH